MSFHRFTGHAGHMLAADIVGAGPPVLLLHGAGQTRASWRATAARLATAGYRAVTMDLRGHGESDWSREGYDLSVLAGDLRCVVDEIGAPPAVIGASLGGLTALAAIGESETPLAAVLVLVDIAPRINQDGAGAIQRFMAANPDGFASVEEAADAVSRYMTDRPRPRDVSGLRRNLRERDGRLFWHWDPAFLRPRDPPIGREQWLARIERAAAHVLIPTLMLRGEHSKVVDEDGVRSLRRLIPHAETAEVGGAGHMIAGDANTPFATTVLDFLARTYPAA